MGTGLVVELTVPSASSNHFCSNGFSLHMFLKERSSASKREMVRLGEVIAVHANPGQTDIPLGITQLDPSLLELLGKFLHLLELDVLVGGQIKAEHGMARRVTREGWRMIGLLLRGREC